VCTPEGWEGEGRRENKEELLTEEDILFNWLEHESLLV